MRFDYSSRSKGLQQQQHGQPGPAAEAGAAASAEKEGLPQEGDAILAKSSQLAGQWQCSSLNSVA